MARTPSPDLTAALDAYTTAASAGLTPDDCMSCARSAVSGPWTPSLSASLSRSLKAAGIARTGRGGDRRSDLDRQIAERLDQMRADIRECRAQAREELTPGRVIKVLPDGQEVVVEQWSALTIEGRARTADALRSLSKPGKPASQWRRHEVDSLTAPAVCDSENRQAVAEYWSDQVTQIRIDATNEIAKLITANAGQATKVDWLASIWGPDRPLVPRVIRPADPPSVAIGRPNQSSRYGTRVSYAWVWSVFTPAERTTHEWLRDLEMVTLDGYRSVHRTVRAIDLDTAESDDVDWATPGPKDVAQKSGHGGGRRWSTERVSAMS